jgi:cytidine deaminase
MSISHQQLLDLAQAAAARAHAPYSRFHVGAALLTSDGQVFLGCNVENSSYGLTNCAERTAVFSAIAAGCHDFVAMAIVQGADGSDPQTPCWPCGACRQVLVEFNPEIELIFKEAAHVRVVRLNTLLPHHFDARRLGQS